MKSDMHFIYVMDEKAKKELLRKGFKLIRENEKDSIWIFENKDITCFEIDVECPHVLSDVLTF